MNIFKRTLISIPILFSLLFTAFPAFSEESNNVPRVCLVWNSTDEELSDEAYRTLVETLEKEKKFIFVKKEDVDKAMKELGFSVSLWGSLSRNEALELGKHLNANYSIAGTFTAMKTLTFGGWRTDFDIYLPFYNTETGRLDAEERSQTGFTWTTQGTDKKYMMEEALKDIIAKLIANQKLVKK